MNNYWKILLAIVVLIVSAYISITLPISERGIPFTAQSLVVFVIAGLFKPEETALVIGVYLALGIFGLPVFAEGNAGWSKLSGSSGGFLYGFLFSGLAISWLLKGSVQPSNSRVIVVMLHGTLVLFVCGLGQLSYKFGWAKALEYGLYPFWKMALVKAMMAALVVIMLRTGWKRAE